MPEADIDRHLPEAVPIVGQTPMDLTRLDKARKLKAIINVETNFLPNVDYGYCAERGVYALTPERGARQGCNIALNTGPPGSPSKASAKLINCRSWNLCFASNCDPQRWKVIQSEKQVLAADAE